MEKTEQKEKNQVKEPLMSYLQDRKIKLVPAKRPNQWKAKFKVENNGSEVNDSGFMFPRAKSWITVPLDRHTGQIKRVLDNTARNKTKEFPNVELTEQEYFERALGLPPGELEPNKTLTLPDGQRYGDSFWKKIEGCVVLKNEAIELDLSTPEDMLRYKILESNFKTIVAPSPKDQNKKMSYRYVVMDIAQIQKDESMKLELELEAIDEFNRISNDIQKMSEIIWMKEGRISESTNISFVKGQCYKYAKENPKDFISIVKHPYRDVKIVLLQAVKKGIITKTKEQSYRLIDGFDIGTMDKALMWLKNPENFDRLEMIKDQIKLAK